MTRISAIITSYNVEPFIATAMQSVIDAGFPDLELILVDDGSTDASCRIAELIGAMAPPERVRYEQIRFSRNTPGGVATAANAGLDRATGDLVIMIDGDDWVLPHHLSAAVELHLRRQPDVTVCGCKEYWNDNGAYTQYPEAEVWQTLPGATTLEAQRDQVLRLAPFPWRKLYSRAFLERHRLRFPVGDFFFEDNPFHWATTMRADSFAFYQPATHVHRMARSGQTVTNMGEKPLKIFEHARTIRAGMIAADQQEDLLDRYIQWLADHILWCARYVPPQALNRLYDLSRDALADLPETALRAHLDNHPRPIVEIRRLSAIMFGDRLGFLREF